MYPVRLETNRLVLREWVEEDWGAVHEYASDPQVVRYMPWGPNTEQDTKDFVKRSMSYQRDVPRIHYELAVTMKENSPLIGGCGIHVHDAKGVCMIGYCFNQRFWGRGYATEAANMLLAFGFRKLKAHRIRAVADPANMASIRVLEKIGMKYEGRLREHQFVRGEWWDLVQYAVLDREWEKGAQLPDSSNIS